MTVASKLNITVNTIQFRANVARCKSKLSVSQATAALARDITRMDLASPVVADLVCYLNVRTLNILLSKII